MIELVRIAIGNAAFVIMLKHFMNEGMIFEFVPKLCTDRLKKFICCPYCYGTWTALAFWFLIRLDLPFLYVFLFLGFNWLFIRLFYFLYNQTS